MPDYLYVAGLNNSNIHLRKYQADDGTAGWTVGYTSGGSFDGYAIAVDKSGANVYFGGSRYSSATTKKYNSSGTLQWAVDHGTAVYTIAVDNSGNVCTGGVRTSSLTTRKYDSSGNLIWSKDHGADVYGIVTDDSGNIYTVGARSSSITTRKYDSSGNLTWSKDHGATAYAIAVDDDGNVYTGGTATGSPSYSIRKYNSSGTLQWSANTTGTPCRGLAIDKTNSFLYAVGNGSTTPFIQRFNLSDGSENTDDNWPITSTAGLISVCVDNNGNVYTGGLVTTSKTTIAWDSTGTEIWSANHGVNVYGVAVTKDIITQSPALGVGVSLGIPSGSGIVTIPALSFSLSLGIPVSSSPPEPPLDTGQVIYRFYLATINGLLVEYPMHSFECRRRRNDSTWLSIALPNISVSQAETLQDYIGNSLVIYAGIRDNDGLETLGEFLRADLESINHDATAYSGIATLTCRVNAINETLQTRALTGVIGYENDNGRKLLKCTDINHRLRPGDTVEYGSISFVAHNVKYAVYPGNQYMTIQEDSV